MNWKELKEFCNQLPDEQLEKKVILWSDSHDWQINNIEAHAIEYNYYIHPAEGLVPEPYAEHLIRNATQSYPNGLADFKKVYHKGAPVLLEKLDDA